MFIAEIQNRYTQASKGFLVEEEYRGQFGFGLTPFRHKAHCFEDENQAVTIGQDLIGDNTSLIVAIEEVI